MYYDQLNYSDDLIAHLRGARHRPLAAVRATGMTGKETV